MYIFLLNIQSTDVLYVANSEINLLNEKNSALERDLEIERRRVRELQDAARDSDKEYQKLKVISRYDIDCIGVSSEPGKLVPIR